MADPVPGARPMVPGGLPAMPAGPRAPESGASPLLQAVVGEALRRIEAAGPLDDASELRQALRSRSSRAGQLAMRNWLLGQRLGLQQEAAHWVRLGALLLAACVLLAALSGWVAARSIVGPVRSINAVAAMVGLLALPTLTLLVWLLGFLPWGTRASTGTGAFSFARLVIALLQRVARRQGAHAPELLQAFSTVLHRQRLWPWFSGLASHGVWCAALLLTLVVLLLNFSFRAYELSWETTILSPHFFEQLVRGLGVLPSWLGLPVPDAETVVARAAMTQAQAGADLPVDQRTWAWWLIGCVLVYGLLPRLFLLGLSLLRWRRGAAALTAVDLAEPYHREILARLDALQPASTRIIDPDTGPVVAASAAVPAHGQMQADTGWVLGFELAPERPWPPPGLPAAGGQVLRVDGSAAQREAAIQQLQRALPQRLLLVLEAGSSPDRGVARFLRESAALAEHTAVLLLGADAGTDAAMFHARWQRWMQQPELPPLSLLDGVQQAQQWLDRGHD